MYPTREFDEHHVQLSAARIKGANSLLLNAAEDTDPATAVIGAFGIPYDCGMFINQGTVRAPNTVRSLSHLYASYCYPHREIFAPDQVFDGGNLVPEDGSASVKDCLNSLKNQVREQLAGRNFRPIFVGGDHTLPYATVAALSEHLGKPLAMIHIDAHPDINNSGDNDFIDDSTFLYDLMKGGHVDPDRTVQLYIRQDVYNHEPNEFLDRVEVVDALGMKEHYQRDGFVSVVNQLQQKMGSDQPVYISLDIDALDMAHAPGTTYPMPGGATNEEIVKLFYQLGQTTMNFYGGEVVEVIPDLDTPSKTTCAIAAYIMRDMAILAWQAAQRAR